MSNRFILPSFIPPNEIIDNTIYVTFSQNSLAPWNTLYVSVIANKTFRYYRGFQKNEVVDSAINVTQTLEIDPHQVLLDLNELNKDTQIDYSRLIQEGIMEHRRSEIIRRLYQKNDPFG